MLHVAVARSSSDGIAVRYALPVLRMTSVVFSYRRTNGQNQAQRLEEFAKRRYQLHVRQLQRLAEFVRMRHGAGVK